jgi:peroxiredoxin
MVALIKPGDNAPDSQFLTIHGESVALSSLWAKGPTILLFLRHFG